MKANYILHVVILFFLIKQYNPGQVPASPMYKEDWNWFRKAGLI